MKSCIVTCADEKFYGLLTDLLGSFHEKGLSSDKDVVVLDLGLSSEQKAELDDAYNFPVDCFQPNWDNVPLAWQGVVDERKQPYLCKPFLRELVPGYDCYTWLDSDVWVQDIAFLTHFEQEAERGNLAICSHVDRCYVPNYEFKTINIGGLHFPYKIRNHLYNRLKDFFGSKVAAQYGFRHMFNTGVISLHHNSPHWETWQNVLKSADLQKQRKRSQLCDQTLLTLATYQHDLPVQIFPATYNWMVRSALPMYDAEKKVLVTPYPPHEQILVVHLAAMRDRTTPRRLNVVNGSTGTSELCLTWSGMQKFQNQNADTG